MARSVASTRPRSQRTTSSRWNACSTPAARPEGRQQAALLAGLADVPPLGVAGEGHRRVGAGGAPGVDVPEGPVVVAADAEVLDRAGGVPLVALQAGQARVEQADVDPAGHGVGIAGDEVLGDGGPREALAVDRHAEVVEADRLGAARRSSTRTFAGQAEGPGHLVGGVVVARDDDRPGCSRPAGGRAPGPGRGPVL